MKDTYTYRIGENLYINLTNRCTNRCVFCVRNGKQTYEGYALWLKGDEPSAEQVICEIGNPKDYAEIVFCGFGEPTFRLDALVKIARFVKERGGRTRLNTNGHGSAINGRDIAPELIGLLDGVNVSLNAPTKSEYEKVCSPLIENGFSEMLFFAKRCKECGINVWLSVVDCIGEEAVMRCKEIAKECGVPLRVRKMIE